MPDLVAGRRRFVKAALVGSLLALIAVAWMLLAGHLDPLRNRGAFSAFFAMSSGESCDSCARVSSCRTWSANPRSPSIEP